MKFSLCRTAINTAQKAAIKMTGIGAPNWISNIGLRSMAKVVERQTTKPFATLEFHIERKDVSKDASHTGDRKRVCKLGKVSFAKPYDQCRFSDIKQGTMPVIFPKRIKALDAPAFFEPFSRISNPRSFAMMYDGLIVPIKYPMNMQNTYFITPPVSLLLRQ